MVLLERGSAYEIWLLDKSLPTIEEVAEVEVKYLVATSEAVIEKGGRPNIDPMMGQREPKRWQQAQVIITAAERKQPQRHR